MILPRLQQVLWEQPPASSDKHVARKLTLCIGLPVMLKYNDATECCITKGAEASVAGWQTSKGPEGQIVLDTLFVKLKNPPKAVKIDGLPENVVPITRHVTATMCSLPNDNTIPLSRDQPDAGVTQFCYDQLLFPGQDQTRQCCGSQQLLLSPIILHLFIEECQCFRHYHCSKI